MKKTFLAFSAFVGMALFTILPQLALARGMGMYGDNHMGPGLLGSGFGIVVGLIGALIGLIVAIVFIVSLWKLFEKAGQAGWKAIVPVYNLVIMCRIVGMNPWFVLLAIVPVINYIFVIFLWYFWAKSYGKDIVYTVGLIFLSIIFLPMMAFDKNTKYIGPTFSYGNEGTDTNSTNASSSTAANSAPQAETHTQAEPEVKSETIIASSEANPPRDGEIVSGDENKTV